MTQKGYQSFPYLPTAPLGQDIFNPISYDDNNYTTGTSKVYSMKKSDVSIISLSIYLSIYLSITVFNIYIPQFLSIYLSISAFWYLYLLNKIYRRA